MMLRSLLAGSTRYATVRWRHVLLAGVLLVGVGDAAAQATWTDLDDAPVTGRHNDVFFVDPTLGWVVNGDGEAYRTSDGGETWTRQLFLSDAHFRSVGFVDEQHGWIGNVGDGEFGATDPNPLYQTEDGGATWTPVESFEGPVPTGLCGMYVVNDSVVVAVGRVRGPSIFARTTDGGRTWQTQDMTEHAAGLIDAYFPHPDTGFVVGLTSTDHNSSAGIVLQTTDGGESWARRHRTSRIGQWAWKISFPTRSVGYVSLQRNVRSPIFFLKTMDGGVSWEEKLFSQDRYFVQGIGFATADLGWIGGNSSQPAYETRDGGETWYPLEIGSRLNRFRFLGDTLGYAVGRTVHKFRAEPASVGVDRLAEIPEPSLSIYPNPAHGPVTIAYELPAAADVRLSIYDVAGRRLADLANGTRAMGVHTITLPDLLTPGAYLVVLNRGDAVQRRLFIIY